MKDLENRMKDAADRMSPENIIKSWLLPGFFVNNDLAGYEVPVHADIPHQEVIFLDETGPMSSPMKAKGVAALGILRRRGRGCERRLQRKGRARARLPDHARQAPRPDNDVVFRHSVC
jgi:hypothetical protein